MRSECDPDQPLRPGDLVKVRGLWCKAPPAYALVGRCTGSRSSFVVLKAPRSSWGLSVPACPQVRDLEPRNASVPARSGGLRSKTDRRVGAEVTIWVD